MSNFLFLLLSIKTTLETRASDDEIDAQMLEAAAVESRGAVARGIRDRLSSKMQVTASSFVWVSRYNANSCLHNIIHWANNESSNDQSIDSPSLPKYSHSLIVFGGVAGIEECVDADESLSLPGSLSRSLFDQWINICPYQASRTIRTEEAVMISLAKLSPLLATAARAEETVEEEEVEPVNFTDDEPSDESSSEEDVPMKWVQHLDALHLLDNNNCL
jgi:hypothetical protein